MKRLSLLLAVVAFPFLVSACGQSGPLYVPGNPSTMAVPPSGDAVESADEDDDAEPDDGD